MTPQKLSFLEYPESFKNLTNVYLQADLGILDVLRFVDGVGDFEAVKKNALQIDFFENPCWILSVEALIAAKKFMMWPKDFLTIKELEVLSKKPKS